MEGRHGRARIAGWGINVALRVAIVAFAAEAALAVGDPRFEGKGIAARNLVFAGLAISLSVPLARAFLRRPRGVYPLRADSLFLSILVVDMAANSLGLYEYPGRLDLIPHAYGPLAAFLALRALGVALVPGMLLVNAGHLLLEVQEAIGDAWLGTHNVRGWTDTIGDLGAGAVGSVLIPCVWLWTRHRSSAHRSAGGRQPASA
jgi:hypothetical protein